MTIYMDLWFYSDQIALSFKKVRNKYEKLKQELKLESISKALNFSNIKVECRH